MNSKQNCELGMYCCLYISIVVAAITFSFQFRGVKLSFDVKKASSQSTA